MILASELSLGAVLLRIVELAVDLTNARYGALGVLTPDVSAGTGPPPPAGSRSGEGRPDFSSRSMTSAGFDVDMTSWGVGLGNLRERVGSLGGVLVVESTPGEGTTVRATFPS